MCVRALFFSPTKKCLSRFFCHSEEEEGKERDTKEREGFFRFKHLSVLLCAPILLLRRPEEKSGVVKDPAAIVGEEGRKRKRRRRL